MGQDHNHEHGHDCGHDHGPPVVHELLPSPERTAVVLVAAGDGARCGALSRLRAPRAEGEAGLARMRRVLGARGWGRWVVVTDRGERGDAARALVGGWASLALADAEDAATAEVEATLAGLRVAFQRTRPPEAALLWSAARPLTSAEALERLLTSGTRQLTRLALPWVRVLARRHELTSVGQPALISRAAAEHLIRARASVREAATAGDGALLVQRVLTDEPWPWTPLETPTDAAPYVVRDDLT